MTALEAGADAGGSGSFDLRAALLQRVRGIGPDRATRLLDAYGDGLDSVLGDIDRIPDVARIIAPDRPILGRRLAAILAAQWRTTLSAEYAATAWLDRNGLVDAPALARRIVRILGARTPEILQANPYVLAKALPWPRMDSVGRRVLGRTLGAQALLRAPQRLLGAVESAAAEFLAEGHTAVPKERMRAALADRLGDLDAAEEAERLAADHLRLLSCVDVWRFPGCAWMEGRVAARLARMPSEAGRIRSTVEDIRQALARVEGRLGIQLADEQRAAVLRMLASPFSVLAGGAGTGKTATMRAIVEAWEELGGRVHLCALAGKAALRLGQSAGRPAKTIHRTLMKLKERRKAQADGAEPRGDWALFDDTTLVIVDEASMVDLGQWAQLLDAMPAGCRLAMVGDVAQLPPIGFGLVFHLLARRPGAIHLTRVHRQTEASGIPLVARAVRDGAMPAFTPFDGPGDGVSFVPCSTARIDGTVEDVVHRLGGFGRDGLGLHVVSALNARAGALNRRFHDMRRASFSEIDGALGARFSPGDPVVHTENDYRRGLFNGMLGSVIEIEGRARSVTVSFEGALHVFQGEDLARIDLAFAITCHKLQGSQAERVVVVVEPTRLIEPSWLYTAITRAERQAVIVGPEDVLRAALRRPPAWTTRTTGFELMRPGTSQPEQQAVF